MIQTKKILYTCMYTSDMTMIFDIPVESLFKVTLNHILINRKVFFLESQNQMWYTQVLQTRLLQP